jgi:flagellar assembly protein FliH
VLFNYSDAGVLSGAPSGGQSDEELSGRQQAEFFEQGRQNAQQQFRSALDAATANHREQINHALQQFALERQSYYRRIESEVVALALAVARKILHREVQIDPHALAGIVRVTLEKLDTGTKISLRVHPQEAAEWRHYFACRVETTAAPDILEDSTVIPGECRIETSIGTTEVGIESQLKEIETGLFDLLAERPDVAGSAPSSTLTAGATTKP